MRDKRRPVQHRGDILDLLIRKGKGQQARDRAEPVLLALGELKEVVLLV